MTPAERNAELAAVQKLMQGAQFDDALSRIDALLATDPEDADAYYFKAVALRYNERFQDAGASLDALISLAPQMGRAYQERGHLLRAQGDILGALKAYEVATRLNPALDASWRQMAELGAAQGQPAPLVHHARMQTEKLAAMPPAIRAAQAHLHDGQLLKAENLCRAFLQKTPHHIEAMRTLALLAVRFNVLDEAEFLLESAHEFAPDDIEVWVDYVQILTRRQKFDAALQHARELATKLPDDLRATSLLAICQMQAGDIESSLSSFDQVLAKAPADPITLTSRGHALKTYGQQDNAIASYRAALAARPEHGEAYFSLSNLKTFKFDPPDLSFMKALLTEQVLSSQDRIYVHFALAKALEDAGEFDAAFAQYAQGNALKKQGSSYDADQMHAELAAQARAVTSDFADKCTRGGCPAPDPIFIVGLPRAGSTLIEQILASHSEVDGTHELPHILATVHKLRGRGAQGRYPDILTDLTDEQALKLGEAYIEGTQIYRQGARYFTDKMPNNFRHIGLIRRILPNAKIIDARRDPMACCFSGYKQLFAEGQEFSYSLSDIGRYYADYVALMDHFDTVMPGAVLRVRHEDVVADLEGQVRRLLDYLELPFEQACLDFHKTERAVRTASSEQVREKINTRGLEQWRNFAGHLDELRQHL